jgi:hypothetical protein
MQVKMHPCSPTVLTIPRSKKFYSLAAEGKYQSANEGARSDDWCYLFVQLELKRLDSFDSNALFSNALLAHLSFPMTLVAMLLQGQKFPLTIPLNTKGLAASSYQQL